MTLITVQTAFKTWNTENVYKLISDKEESTITKKPLQKGDRYSLSCENNGTTFAVIKNGSDCCISVIKKKEDKNMILVPIKEVHGNWKNDQYFYQNKAITKLGYSPKSQKYQLSFEDNTKLIVDASVDLQKLVKIAPAQTTAAPKIEDKVTVTYITAPAPQKEATLVEAPKEEATTAPAQTTAVEAPKEEEATTAPLTIDIVHELAMQLSPKDRHDLGVRLINEFSNSQKANFAYTLINAVLSTALRTIETAPAPQKEATLVEAPKEEATTAPAQTTAVEAPKEEEATTAPKEKLSKEYPDHYDRLVTWIQAKYPGVEIKDILINWGDKEINGVKRISCKQIGERAGIGPATINEELATICLLESLKHGVLIEYLNQSNIANIGDNVKKLSTTKQLEVYNFIIKLWENNNLSFNIINNAVKKYIKTNENSDVAYCLQVCTGKKPLVKNH